MHLPKQTRSPVALTALLSVRIAVAGEPTAEQLDFFERKIRPVLVERCYECHSIERNKSKGGLLLDTRDGTLKGGDSGPSIAPGDPDKSLLIKAVRYIDEDLQMPPKHRLHDDQIAALVEWIKMGAPDPRKATSPTPADSKGIDIAAGRKFWSFQPIKDPAPPSVKNKRWPKNAVDHFILAKLEEKGMTPDTTAEKRTLIRRATFDLTGLPPTPEQVEVFVNDNSLAAFEKVVERLLNSPHYGERWGRHWLDVVRYADTAGDSSDYPIPQAHKYRDYVIKSFNEDKPYGQFLREQIAGDLLPSKTDAQKYEKIIATGYLALARRFSVNPEGYQHLTIEDTIDNLGKSLLGLSVSCARCHDHKYDPVPTEDYYALYGIFHSTRYPFAGSENEKKQRNLVPLAAPEVVEAAMKELNEKLTPIEEEVKRLEEERDALRKALTQADKSDEELEKAEADKPKETNKRTLTEVREEIRKARNKRDEVAKKFVPQYAKAFAVIDGTPKNAKIHIRGEPGKQGAEVPRRFLQVLGGHPLPPDAKGSGRTELADWLADPKNPLTARVMVNRIWQYHFGKGIVQTPNDFGARGKAPTHPEVLDFLATRFIESGWSIKAMQKLIMLSQTYQQSSRDNPSYAKLDPNNELLWKFDRQRLDAESIRDAMLFVSGGLDTKAPAAHPFPPEEKWGYTQHNPFNAVYDSTHRSVYLMQQRIKKHPYLELFDGADPNSSTAVRVINTTPLQSLFMMNDRFAHQQAEKFAGRLLDFDGPDSARIDLACRIAFGRPASREELRVTQNHLRAYREKLKAEGVQLEQEPLRSWSSLARVIFGSNEFIFVD